MGTAAEAQAQVADEQLRAALRESSRIMSLVATLHEQNQAYARELMATRDALAATLAENESMKAELANREQQRAGKRTATSARKRPAAKRATPNKSR